MTAGEFTLRFLYWATCTIGSSAFLGMALSRGPAAVGIGLLLVVTILIAYEAAIHIFRKIL